MSLTDTARLTAMVPFHTEDVDLEPDAWAALLAAVESTLATPPFRYVPADDQSPRIEGDPPAWCARHLTGRERAIIATGTEGEFVSIYVIPRSAQVVPGCGPDIVYAPGTRRLRELGIMLSETPDKLASLPAMIAAVGPIARALTGHYTPWNAITALRRGAGRATPDPGQPYPQAPYFFLPREFHWVNWWSEDICRDLGFSPDDARAGLFAKVTPVPGRGVALQLTEDPLDLSRPDHLAALTAAYQAFPQIDENWGR